MSELVSGSFEIEPFVYIGFGWEAARCLQKSRTNCADVNFEDLYSMLCPTTTVTGHLKP